MKDDMYMDLTKLPKTVYKRAMFIFLVAVCLGAALGLAVALIKSIVYDPVATKTCIEQCEDMDKVCPQRCECVVSGTAKAKD